MCPVRLSVTRKHGLPDGAKHTGDTVAAELHCSKGGDRRKGTASGSTSQSGEIGGKAQPVGPLVSPGR